MDHAGFIFAAFGVTTVRDLGGDTARVVNSHATAPGDSIDALRT